ncbi:MAG: TNT domain-containing protein [Pseudonocardiaceae bacterium]
MAHHHVLPRYVLPRWVGALLAATTLAGVVAAAPAAADPNFSLARCSTSYFDADARLGPDQLPAPGQSEVGDEVAGYQRTGAETPDEFLRQYYDSTANGGQGGFIYPPANGFVTDSTGQPVERPETLAVGSQVDRYGSEFGGFLAPYGTPYSGRSIPPANLDTSDPDFTCNYHAYRVLKPFAAEAGPAAPWFAQPGGGEQYQLDGALLPGGPARPNVKYLIDNGYLQRLN